MIFLGSLDCTANPASSRSQLRLATTCRPSMTAQRVPLRPTQTTSSHQPTGAGEWARTTGSIRTAPVADKSESKDCLAKTLRFEEEDSTDSPSEPKRRAEDGGAGSARERRPSLEGEQTRIQFRQRKLARSPGGATSRCLTESSESERLKELEKREKAMKLKIQLKLAKEAAAKEEVKEDAQPLSGASPTLQRTGPPCSYTMMTSEDIDDVIGLTTTSESADDDTNIPQNVTDVINNNNNNNNDDSNATNNNNDDDNERGKNVEKEERKSVAMETTEDADDGSDDSILSASLENLTLDQLNQSIMDCDDELHAMAEKSVSANPDVDHMRKLIERQAKRQASILARQARLEDLLAKLVDNKAQTLPRSQGAVINHEKIVTPSRNSAFSSVSPAHSRSPAPLTNAQMTLVRSVVKPSGVGVGSKRSAFAPVNVITATPSSRRVDQSEPVSRSEKVADWLEKCQGIPVFKTYLPRGLSGLEAASIAARLLDEEVAHYMRSGPISSENEWSCDRPRDPIGQAFIFGDDKHFVPVQVQ